MVANAGTLKRRFKEPLVGAKAEIKGVSIQDLDLHLDDGETVLVDVCEPVARESDGQIPGSVRAPRSLLVLLAVPESPGDDAPLEPEYRIALYCGTRFAFTAKALLDMSYRDVASLADGYAAQRSAQGV